MDTKQARQARQLGIRIPVALWTGLAAIAKRENNHVSSVARRLLTAAVNREDREDRQRLARPRVYDAGAFVELPLVLFDEDLCRVLKLSQRTLKRLRHKGAFPIPELPTLDRRHRYSRQDVLAFLTRSHRMGHAVNVWPERLKRS